LNPLELTKNTLRTHSELIENHRNSLITHSEITGWPSISLITHTEVTGNCQSPLYQRNQLKREKGKAPEAKREKGKVGGYGFFPKSGPHIHSLISRPPARTHARTKTKTISRLGCAGATMWGNAAPLFVQGFDAGLAGIVI